MPPLYFTKNARTKVLPDELRLLAVEDVWQSMATTHPGKHSTISGALHDACGYKPSDIGYVTMREFYRALMKGKLNNLFGCDLRVEHSGKSEALVRERGSWFWLQGIARQMARPEGLVVMQDGGTRRPHDSLICLLKESYHQEAQMLKIGFHRLCQHDSFLEKREQWKEEDTLMKESEASMEETPASVIGQPTVDVIVGVPVAAVEDVPDTSRTKRASVKRHQKKVRVYRRGSIPGDPIPGSVHYRLIETCRDFKDDVRKRNRINDPSLFVNGVAHGPSMEEYKMLAKKRKTINGVIDFYINTPSGVVLRSERDVFRYFS